MVQFNEYGVSSKFYQEPTKPTQPKQQSSQPILNPRYTYLQSRIEYYGQLFREGNKEAWNLQQNMITELQNTPQYIMSE